MLVLVDSQPTTYRSEHFEPEVAEEVAGRVGPSAEGADRIREVAPGVTRGHRSAIARPAPVRSERKALERHESEGL
jgi:hypothetical protein